MADEQKSITQAKEKQKPGVSVNCTIIAGPCSAESEEQVLKTATALQKSGASWFRAGIWKPRTNPDSFSGVGKKGLPWLVKAREETGLKLAVEVARARHVEHALKHNIDLLWLGARTTVSPFNVQEIADALQGVQVDVMIKNPINPDVELWSGGIERLQRANVNRILTCHRGFNVYGKSVLRNQPLWEIPIELKRRYPELPMICDPSHIAGRRDMIQLISQKALDLGYEGLMIETHYDPSVALSDASQQLKPEVLIQMLGKLQFHQRSTDNADYYHRISFLRDEIDEIDKRLLDLLAERMEAARSIGFLKKENDLPFYQYDRWSEIIQNVKGLAREMDLKEEFVLKLFSLMHLESIDIQGE